MKKILFSLIFLLSFSLIYSQSSNNDIYVKVDIMPEFIDGQAQMNRFLFTNLIYPESLYNSGIGGVVSVSFIVEKDGSISNPEIVESLNEECDTEVLRVISIMPKWTPGKQEGKEARVKVILPVNFYEPAR